MSLATLAYGNKMDFVCVNDSVPPTSAPRLWAIRIMYAIALIV